MSEKKDPPKAQGSKGSPISERMVKRIQDSLPISPLRRSSVIAAKQSGQPSRRDHLQKLLTKRRLTSDLVRQSISPIKSAQGEVPPPPPLDLVAETPEPPLPKDDYVKEIEEEMEATDETMVSTEPVRETAEMLEGYSKEFLKAALQDAPLELRVEDLTYTVSVDTSETQVKTVFNASCLYPLYKLYRQVCCGEQRTVKTLEEKRVLDNCSLLLRPGKMYLVLGPPGAGKTTLLRAMTGLLRPAKNETVEGTILYNGRDLKHDKEFYISNAFAYISQLDKHAPRLTVKETFEFAFQCKSGGQVVRDKELLTTDEAKEDNKKASKSCLTTQIVMAGLGLSEVADTFVGDTQVRGVSGGQRRRVTVGEMYMARAPVLCGDEISTGLDSASTYDMIQMLLHFGRVRKFTRVISLLQPSPETVSLFDEVIVMAEGSIIYCGPVSEVEEYFANLGFSAPDFMDVADFLQVVSTDERDKVYDPPQEVREKQPVAPTVAELAGSFRESEQGIRIKEALKRPPSYVWTKQDSVHGSKVSNLGTTQAVRHRYANNFFRSTWLILIRFMKLWKRDKRVIIAGAVKNILMGVSVGGVFYDTTDPISIQGCLFQAGLFIMLGAMQTSSGIIEDRIVYYKQADANFYSAWPFVFGRTISQMPQNIMDVLVFGIILYYMVGLGGREEASNLFIYLAILIVFSILMSQQLAVFGSFANSSGMQSYSACAILLMMLFGGFIIAPSAIPSYWEWLYWINPFAWTYRALILNEFYSPRWERDPSPGTDAVLTTLGFLTPAGDPFGKEWIGYGFCFMILYYLLCCVLTAIGLTFVRNEGGVAPEPPASKDENDNQGEGIEIEFKQVTLSFQDLCYEVTASTKREKLLLLKSVNGIFRPGRMCALMGSSGAGKTTLMDVIALRKRTGTVTGKVLLNGWPQEAVSFRRCSGYVEQFDVQSPQLTVKETIMFSAKMRLDPKLIPNDEDIQSFVSFVIQQVDLTALADALVGTDETGGLSFEQKKRLSIAVELAAAPSILFLDEPTSGLDARSALLVVDCLRKISDSGRTIVATIHQPSSTVFDMFDDLLLLKKGGQVVYHGELGESSQTLVSYFESKGAPRIDLGENPANWMLRVITMESMGDLAETYVDSEGFKSLKEELGRLEADPGEKIEFDSEFAVPGRKRRELVSRRLTTIYWRSPTYNLTRITVSLVIAFLLGSVFITDRNKTMYTENEMRARLSVIFISFIIVGIMAINSVIPVMTAIRDMYYRHSDAGMYGSGALGLALGVAEKWFLVVSSALFTLVFLVTSHIYSHPFSVGFWGFFTFNFALYSYFGQAFVCLVKPAQTAYILASVLTGLNNFFSGLIVRPQFVLGTFFAIPYYITPGHYVYEGLVVTLYHEQYGIVVANENSTYAEWLEDRGINCTVTCEGSIQEYIDFFFGGDFTRDHIVRNACILGGILVLVRVTTWLALQYIRFG